MKKYCYIVLIIIFHLTMFCNVVYADTEDKKIELVNETYLNPVNNAAWTYQEYIISSEFIFDNTIDQEGLPRLYTTKDFSAPTVSDESVVGTSFATYTLTMDNKQLPDEITFQVIGPNGQQQITINTTSSNSITIGYDFWQVQGAEESNTYYNTSLFIIDENSMNAYEIVGSKLEVIDGSTTYWTIPTSIDSIEYEITFSKDLNSNEIKYFQVIEDTDNIIEEKKPNENVKLINEASNLSILLSVIASIILLVIAIILLLVKMK